MKTPRNIAAFADSVAVFAVAAAVLCRRFLTGAGDCCHPESSAFLQNFTDPSRPLLQILYDPLRTDWNLYQARELASFFDWCDAQFIAFTIRHGHATFFSAVNALLVLAAAMVLHTGFRRWMPKLGRWGAALLALAFVLAPASASSSAFFRSSKPLTSLGIAVAGISLWSLVLRRNGALREQLGAWSAFGISLCLLPYCDRQGLFAAAVFAMAGAAFLGLFSLRRQAEFFGVSDSDRKRLAVAVGIASLAVVAATIYNLEIAPRLICRLNGYRPSFEYQNVGTGGGINPVGGCLYFFDNIGFTLCGISGALAATAGVAALSLWIFCCRKRILRGPGGWLLLLLVAGSCAAMAVSACMMTGRHALILRSDVIHSAYFMPFVVVLILLAAVTAEMWGDTLSRKRFLLPVAAAAVLAFHGVGMLLPQPPQEEMLRFYIDSSPELIRCLNDPGRDAERVPLPYSYLKLIEHFRTLHKTPSACSPGRVRTLLPKQDPKEFL